MTPTTQQDLARDPEGYARQILLRLLSDRPRSRFELAGALDKKHVPHPVAESLLDRFEEVGLVDDEEFARAWVHSRQRSKGLASRMLAMELRGKGIDDDLVRDVLSELDDESERAAAHRLVHKKLRSVVGLDPSTQVRRLTAMLARKGYAPQVAFDVVKAELTSAVELLDNDQG